MAFFCIGQQIEVSQEDEGYEGSWFTAEVQTRLHGIWLSLVSRIIGSIHPCIVHRSPRSNEPTPVSYLPTHFRPTPTRCAVVELCKSVQSGDQPGDSNHRMHIERTPNAHRCSSCSRSLRASSTLRPSPLLTYSHTPSYSAPSPHSNPPHPHTLSTPPSTQVPARLLECWTTQTT